MSTVLDILPAAGVHGSRPAATAVTAGGLYSCTTHGLIYRSDGAVWATYATLVPAGGTAAYVLTKTTGTDYDFAWAAAAGGGGGGGSTNEHTPVRVASFVNGTLATAFANGQVVDGVTLATGDRILLAAQTTGSENGPYTVNASGAPTRATDADAAGELVTGSWMYVTDGSKNARSTWTLTNTGTITIGTTAQVWQRIGGEFRYSAASGIVLSPTAGPTGAVSGTQMVGVGEGAAGGNLSTVSATNVTGLGHHSLYKNNGNSNTGVGADALNEASTGTDLTAIGRGAGSYTSGLASTDKTTTGIKNTLLGAYALAGTTSSRATAIGANSNTKFSDTTALGESTVGTQVFQTHTGPRALALTKMATPHTSSGSANDIELMADVDGATKLILKAVLNAKVVPIVHELGVTYTPPFTTAGRPSASASGAGYSYYDTTLSKPAWSDGTVWRDAAGTAV